MITFPEYITFYRDTGGITVGDSSILIAVDRKRYVFNRTSQTWGLTVELFSDERISEAELTEDEKCLVILFLMQ